MTDFDCMSNQVKPEEIIDFIKDNFSFADNLPEDFSIRENICLTARASLLIDSYCTTGRFANFMKGGGRYFDGKWFYTLPEPVVVNYTYYSDRKKDYVDERASFKNFEVVAGNSLIPDKHGQTGAWHLNMTCRLEKEMESIDFTDSPQSQVAKDALKEFKQKYSSKFKLCRHITPYNTPERACRFF